MNVLTLHARKLREATRRRVAARAVMAELEDFSANHGGRFHVFGTAATGTMRYDSDFDVLIDCPPDLEPQAFTAVERVCAERDLPLDALAYHTMSARFLTRIGGEAIVIGAPDAPGE